MCQNNQLFNDIMNSISKAKKDIDEEIDGEKPKWNNLNAKIKRQSKRTGKKLDKLNDLRDRKKKRILDKFESEIRDLIWYSEPDSKYWKEHREEISPEEINGALERLDSFYTKNIKGHEEEEDYSTNRDIITLCVRVLNDLKAEKERDAMDDCVKEGESVDKCDSGSGGSNSRKGGDCDWKRINPRDIHGSLWRGRDFEIKRLWQRSLILLTFMVACFAGYFVVLQTLFNRISPFGADNPILPVCSCMAGSGSQIAALSSTVGNTWYFVNIIALVVALLGVVFSIFWIMMGKGSKAWQEYYEQAITNFENNCKYVKWIVAQDMREDQVKHGALPKLREVNNCLFSTAAGGYSVSKINIAIGQVFFIFWILVYVFHAFLFPLMPIVVGNRNAQAVWNGAPLVGIVVAAFVLLAILSGTCWLTMTKQEKWVRSTYIW